MVYYPAQVGIIIQAPPAGSIAHAETGELREQGAGVHQEKFRFHVGAFQDISVRRKAAAADTGEISDWKRHEFPDHCFHFLSRTGAKNPDIGAFRLCGRGKSLYESVPIEGFA